MPRDAVSRREFLKVGVAVGLGVSMGAVVTGPGEKGVGQIGIDEFERAIGSSFILESEATHATVRLLRVARLHTGGGQMSGDAFSLVFEGGGRYGQGTYRLSSGNLGSFSTFLVPLGEPTSPRLTATLNRMVR